MSNWLIDKSALARLGRSAEPDVWADRIERGRVRICVVTQLEVGYSARSLDDLRTLRGTPPLAALVTESITPAVEERALQVQEELAARGHHRGPSLADILLAATAEIAHLTVLHLDKDFELIASLTGQPVERLRLASDGDGDTGRDR
ncbi:PIN domain nuclease [Herbiconiux moechotypicola]|uniref:Ribonuclease VapC n=1 Tax=Herbiconiux moechotypicola TaxID=637393 RepID=A0ABP5Q0E7_9MICO|nr:PIN domain nuclease [Herbiconiux moechotypicola]MCS5728631.1 PIN domain nuclease [Herbiconiux moechotypicola]